MSYCKKCGRQVESPFDRVTIIHNTSSCGGIASVPLDAAKHATPAPRSSTATLIKALSIMAKEDRSEDGIAGAALLEASQRLSALSEALEFMVDVGCEHYDMDCGPNGAVAIKQAREALGELVFN